MGLNPLGALGQVAVLNDALDRLAAIGADLRVGLVHFGTGALALAEALHRFTDAFEAADLDRPISLVPTDVTP